MSNPPGCVPTYMHVWLYLWSSCCDHPRGSISVSHFYFSGQTGPSCQVHPGHLKIMTGFRKYTHTSISAVRKGQENKCSMKSSQESEDVERAESPYRLLLVSFWCQQYLGGLVCRRSAAQIELCSVYSDILIPLPACYTAISLWVFWSSGLNKKQCLNVYSPNTMSRAEAVARSTGVFATQVYTPWSL